MMLKRTTSQLLLLLNVAIHFGQISSSSTKRSCNPLTNKCFEFVMTQQLYWTDAQTYCQNNFLNGNLASISDKNDLDIISSALQFFNTDPWLGGVRFGHQPFQWVDGSPFTYTNWCIWQPTVGNNYLQIVHQTTTNCTAGQWIAASSATSANFICETAGSLTTTMVQSTTTPNTATFCMFDKCFALVIGSFDWRSGQGYCEANFFPNGNLASIDNMFEEKAIAALLQASFLTSNPWIGAVKSGDQWQWSDHTSMNFEDWCSVQSDPDGRCGQIEHKYDGSCRLGNWIKADCAMIQTGILCEYGNFTDAATTSTAKPIQTTTKCSAATDCYDYLYCHGVTVSGVQTLHIEGSDSFDVYCDMETDGGGWTVFQRRMDSSEVFQSRSWRDYSNGFGNPSTNYWLGLNRMHILTAKDTHIDVRIDVYGDRDGIFQNCPPTYQYQCYPNGRWFGVWQGFAVGSRDGHYRLTVGSKMSGNMSEQEDFTNYNGMLFTTEDTDNDNYPGNCGNGNCAVCTCGGGWWYNSGANYCNVLTGRFNGNYLNGCFSWVQQVTGSDGTHSWWRAPKTSELKLRRRP